MRKAFTMSSSLKRKRSEVLDTETRPPPPSWSQLDNESLIRTDNSKKVATACKGCRKQKVLPFPNAIPSGLIDLMFTKDKM